MNAYLIENIWTEGKKDFLGLKGRARLFLVRILLKLTMELLYRKYGKNPCFRADMEELFSITYAKAPKNKEKFIRFAFHLAFTNKVKEMLREDAEEGVCLAKLRRECEEHRAELEEAFSKFKERLNALSTVQKF